METFHMEYSVTLEAKDSHKDRLTQTAALFSLRCLLQNDFWISLNVSGVDVFGDIILHQTDVTYIIKLEYGDNPNGTQEQKHLETKGDFSLEWYFNDIANLHKTLELDKLEVTETLGTFSKIYFVLLTNREVKGCKFLEDISGNDVPCFLNTNFEVYQVDLEKLTNGVNITNDFNNPQYLLIKQNYVEDISTEIVEEIKQILGNSLVDNEIAQEFIKFITDYSQANLTEHHYLTKQNILCKFTELFLRRYEVKFYEDQFCYCDRPIWKEIISDKTITMLESDETVLKFLVEYISGEVNKFCKGYDLQSWSQILSEEEQNFVCQEFIGYKIQNFGRKGKPTLVNIYKCLWMNGKLSLLLDIDNDEDLNNIQKVLKLSNYSFKVILMNKSGKNVSCQAKEDGIKCFCSLQDLSEDDKRKILMKPVKLQGRSAILLGNLVDESQFPYINCNDIINIIVGIFNIGNSLQNLPEYLIQRSFSKVFLELSVLDKIRDETFLIEDFENCFDSLPIQNSNVHNLENFNFTDFTPGLIISQKRVATEKLENLKSASQTFHHLTIYGKKYLEWKNSFGSIKKVEEFRVDLTEEETNISKKFFNPVTIINGAPGMGKSTLLDSITCEAPVNKWVLRINLSEHQKYYERPECKTMNTNASIHLDYFLEYFLDKHKCNTELTKTVFLKMASKKDVIVLLDGFDEVSVSFKEEVTNIAKSLHTEGFHMWITTRPVMKSYLEEHFNTFSVDLKPFTRDIQRQFLNKYFGGLILGSETLIADFVGKLLDVMEKNLKERDAEFAGVPLLTRLLADVFQEECENYISSFGAVDVKENFDVLYLYQNFVENKINILCDKFGATEQNVRKLLKEHQSLFAIKLLFPLHDFVEIDKELEYYETVPDKMQLLQREGVIVIDAKLNIKFTHRTFAEYIAAEWLSENINNEKSAILINERFTHNYKFLFNIFDRILAKNCPLHLAIINGQLEEAKKIINLDCNSVTSVDKGGRSALHIMALYSIHHPLLFHEYANFYPSFEATKFLNLKSFEKDGISDIIEKITNYKVLDIKKDILGYSALDYALANNSLAAANKIYAKSKLSTISANINLNLKKNYLGYCAILNYKSLFNLLLPYFAFKDFSLKSIDGNINVNTYFQSMYSSNTHTKSILNYKIDFGTMTILDLLHSKSAYSGYINGHYTDLRYAIIFDSIDDVKSLLEEGIEINKLDNNDSNTPLHYTSLYGRPECAHLLLSKKARPNTQNDDKDTPLHVALRKNQIQVAKLLLANGARGNLANKKGETALHYAIQQNQQDIVKKILSVKETNDKQNTSGNTPLHLAINGGQLDTAESLLFIGVDSNVANKIGETPLHTAIERGYVKVVQQILFKGFNNKQNINGDTPLHVALMKRQWNIVESLISSGADVNLKNNRGESALHWASQNGHTNTVKKILSKCTSVNNANSEGNTPLHLALISRTHDAFQGELSKTENDDLEFATNSQYETGKTLPDYDGTVELLLGNGADINIPNKRSCDTGLHLLIQYGYNSIVKKLLAEGTANSEGNNDYNTPLHLALIYGYLDIAELLISNGASVNSLNKMGNSALHCIIQNGRDENILSKILSQIVNIDSQDCEGNTALHLAVIKKNMAIVEKLLLKNVNVNIKNQKGDTALSFALENNCSNVIVNKMLSQPFTDSKWEKDGDNLLHLALKKGLLYAAKLLVSYGLDVNKANKNRETPLYIAVQKGYIDILEKLISKDNVNLKQRKDGNTPLHWALVNNDINTMKLLISNGASVNEGNKKGKTVLHCAIKKGYHAMITQFLSIDDVDVNKQSKNGDAALHLAVRKGDIEIVKLLLSVGADDSLKNKKEQTPLHLAEEVGNFEITSLLRKRVLYVS